MPVNHGVVPLALINLTVLVLVEENGPVVGVIGVGSSIVGNKEESVVSSNEESEFVLLVERVLEFPLVNVTVSVSVDQNEIFLGVVEVEPGIKVQV